MESCSQQQRQDSRTISKVPVIEIGGYYYAGIYKFTDAKESQTMVKIVIAKG
jgi:hypothetical protein